MSNPLSYDRETGIEKSSSSCPICGDTVPMVTSGYGSTAPGACGSCWPSSAPSQLAAQQAAAEVPEPVSEAPVVADEPVADVPAE
jgi:hypothetical protein